MRQFQIVAVVPLLSIGSPSSLFVSDRTLGTMCGLNEDILRHIVDYLPDETLDRINGSHPVFYQAWMKSRYASICITKANNESKRLLAHLCEPYVARYVRRLKVQPWFTDNVVVSRYLQMVDRDGTRNSTEQKRFSEDIKKVTAAFMAMTELQEYSIDWDGSDRFHPELYRAFLVPPLEIWAKHLTRLSICVPLSMISSLACLRLPYLESFTYHFCTGNTPLKDIDDAHDGFVVFVNNLKDSLQALSFLSTSISQHLDLSRIFRTLGIFPSLKKVVLSIPFDGGQLSNPMTFVKFLKKHRESLQEFNLLTTRCSSHSKPGDPAHIYWIQHILQSIKRPFPLLSGVGIALRPRKAPLGTLVDFLDLHSSTLQSVSLMDRSLGVHEIESLWSVGGSRNIVDLHVKVDALSASLLARFARRFPNLETLELECNRVDIDRSCAVDGDFRQQGVSEFFANLQRHGDHIRYWGLKHLIIDQRSLANQIKRDLVYFLPHLTVSSCES
ncbi:hypothetical protein BJ912DRAFT_301257 [Pholiota molesta]|nr:hypothetical protein BJ912DRAFT_301257 [Pholiota molesta]